MNIEVVTSRQELDSLAMRWDELARNDSRDGFFRTFGWYKAWIDHIRPDAEPFVIVARDRSNAILGLTPLCRLPYRDLGFRLDGLVWAGREVVSGDFLDFLTENAVRHEVVTAMVRFLGQVRSRWGLLVTGELLDGSDSCCALERMGLEHRMPIRRQEERICPFIALPRSFDQYLAGLGSATRYHIRRRMRDVEKMGGAVEAYSRPEEIAQRLDTMVRLHLARWQKDHLPGTFGRPGFVAFLKQVIGNPPRDCSWRLYELLREDRPAAALLTFYFGESALYYQAGWDPDSELAALSPGVVLMAHSISDAVKNGLRFYEFLRGDEAYKSHWTKTYRKTITLLFARSMMAKKYLAVARLKDSLKPHLPFRAQTVDGPFEHCADSQ